MSHFLWASCRAECFNLAAASLQLEILNINEGQRKPIMIKIWERLSGFTNIKLQQQKKRLNHVLRMNQGHGYLHHSNVISTREILNSEPAWEVSVWWEVSSMRHIMVDECIPALSVVILMIFSFCPPVQCIAMSGLLFTNITGTRDTDLNTALVRTTILGLP